MPQRITTTDHNWIGAACIPLEGTTAKRAADRQSVRTRMLDTELKIEILEVYCLACRRNYEDAADVPCAAAETNEHLRGGPIKERAKRGHRYHDCDELGCYPNGVHYGSTGDGQPAVVVTNYPRRS